MRVLNVDEAHEFHRMQRLFCCGQSLLLAGLQPCKTVSSYASPAHRPGGRYGSLVAQRLRPRLVRIPPRCGQIRPTSPASLRWMPMMASGGTEVVRFPRQFGGLAKVDSGFDYAASFSACSSIA